MKIEAKDCYVLHVVPPNGGGVDRYVRDICARRANDRVLHVSQLQVVFESPQHNQFVVIDTASAGDTQWVAALGQPALVHAHSSLQLERETVVRLCAILKIPYVVTLHDVAFSEHTQNHADEADIVTFIADAKCCVAPSQFIRELAVQSGCAGADIVVIPNGADCEKSDVAYPSTLNIANAANPQFEVAVVGALGEHKGLSFLKETVSHLPENVRVVLVGYADGALSKGWLLPEKLWVHGPFEPAELRSILDAYGCKFVLFPNRQPESFSYSLSDVWCSGRPALVPDVGALGERMRAAGCGALYPAHASARDVSHIIVELLSSSRLMKIPPMKNGLSIAEMCSRLTAIYDRYASNAYAPPEMNDSTNAAEIAVHLNSAFFRAELVKLNGDVAFSNDRLTRTLVEIDELAERYRGRGEWVSKLETDVQGLSEENLRVARIAAQREADVSVLTRDVEKLTIDVTDTLKIAHRYERALSMLPKPVRNWALRRADEPKKP